MVGQFRKGEAVDPPTFITSVAAVLARYSEEVVVRVTDPRTGLASKGDWLPTIHEICKACDELAEVENDQARRARDLKAQFQRRIEDERPRTQADRDRVQAKLQELRDAREAAAGRRTAAEQRTEAEAALARLLAEANAGPSVARSQAYAISDELREQIGMRLAADAVAKREGGDEPPTAA